MDEHLASNEPEETTPWTFSAVKWYGYVISACFLLYGGVNIILGVLDRDYTKTPDSLLFLVIGVVLVSICIAYRDRKQWGWYGLLAVNGLIVVRAAIGFSEPLNLVFLFLSILAIGLLVSPKTKAEIG
jgi:hypothetical protein